MAKSDVAVVQTETMADLWQEVGGEPSPIRENELVDVTILSMAKNRIWADVAGIALGFIPEREFSSAVRELKPGDQVVASIIASEDEQGNVVLSLKRAERERSLFTLREKFEAGQTVPVRVTECNRGGLLVDAAGVSGFLPISQLSPLHYPKVSPGNRDELLQKLQELVGQSLEVKVITFDKNAGKLIFSEKAAQTEIQEERAAQFKMGDKVMAKITGVMKFGLFVDLGGGLDGLVHISEVAWERIPNLEERYKIGQEVEVMVLSVVGGRVSLSMKRLQPNSWADAAGSYELGQWVEGVVTRITPYGAFVKLDDRLDGLAHISQLSEERISSPSDVLETGKSYRFRIVSIEPDTHRIGLSMLSEDSKKAEKSRRREAAQTEGEVAGEAAAEEPAPTEEVAQTEETAA